MEKDFDDLSVKEKRNFIFSIILKVMFGILFVVAIVWGLCALGAVYSVWSKGLSGKAQLKEAEWNRQITIKEAEAKKESAVSLAEAEVIRARGVAKANEIIGVSLKNNEAYLRYLWIENLNTKGNEVIYIPTEAGIPILEAGKRK